MEKQRNSGVDMFRVKGISKIIWQYAKSSNPFPETYSKLLTNIQKELHKYLEFPYEFTENEILDMVIRAYCDYADYGIRHHLSYGIFRHIIGDKAIENIYPDSADKSTPQKVIEGILIALRNSQVYDNDKQLIDYGQ